MNNVRATANVGHMLKAADVVLQKHFAHFAPLTGASVKCYGLEDVIAVAALIQREFERIGTFVSKDE